MKTLQIPFSEQLNSATIADAALILEKSGRRLVIESVNWPKQFPYKPITHCVVARSSHSLFLRFYVWGNMLKAVYYSASPGSLQKNSTQLSSCTGD